MSHETETDFLSLSWLVLLVREVRRDMLLTLNFGAM